MSTEILGPDCRDEKHRACSGDALDEVHDDIVQCQCGCHTFARIADDEAESFQPGRVRYDSHGSWLPERTGGED